MNRNFLLALSLFMFLTLTPCNAQRNEKLCCGHKPDSAVIVLNNQAVNVYTHWSNIFATKRTFAFVQTQR